MSAAAGERFTLRWDGRRAYEERTVDLDRVDALLDAFLERLTSPTSTCRACGGRVLVTARWFEVFERMHYGCFHYAFEHGDFDRDEECTLDGCPSAAIEPWHVTNDPRDALVGQLLDDLRSGDLAGESLVTSVEREGPGVIRARFDEQAYLVTVRRVAQHPTQHPTQDPAQERESSDRV